MALRLTYLSCSTISQENTVRQCGPLRGFSRRLLRAASLAILTLPNMAVAQTTAEIPPGISTPDKLQTRLGAFEFKDGAPSKETVEKVYDNLDFMHASETFLNAFRGASLVAARKGFISAGTDDNSIMIFSELMDSKSLFLTANADTVYYFGFLDLTKGPLVAETPPLARSRNPK